MRINLRTIKRYYTLLHKGQNFCLCETTRLDTENTKTEYELTAEPIMRPEIISEFQKLQAELEVEKNG